MVFQIGAAQIITQTASVVGQIVDATGRVHINGKPARDVLLWSPDNEETEETTTAIDENGDDVTTAFHLVTPRNAETGGTGLRSIQFERFGGGWLLVRRSERLCKVWRVNVQEDGEVTLYEAKTQYAAADGNAGTIGLSKELCEEMEAAGL